MTGDEATSPVRALRPAEAATAQGSPSGPEELRVDLESSSVEVLVRVSSEGGKHDNLLLLGQPSEADAEALAGLLPNAHVLAPSLEDLGWRGSSHDVRASTARAVVGLMDHFAIERAVLVGMEAGADLAVAVAAAHPDRVGALVLVNGGLGARAESGSGAEGIASPSRDELSGLRVPVAFLYGGSVGASIGYTDDWVHATTAWLRHVDAHQVSPGEHGNFDAQALALVADIADAQLASVRARAAHPATGSHRVISPADDED